MNKHVVAALFFLGLICLTYSAITTVTIPVTAQVGQYNGLIGQTNYTMGIFETSNDTIRSPSGLAYNSVGGLYITDVGTNGGRIVYYADPSNNTPTYVLGGTLTSNVGSLSPSGLAVYSNNGIDYYVAVGSQGNGFNEYHNVTGGTTSSGDESVTQIATTYGPNAAINIMGVGNFLSLEVQNSTGSLILADYGNNRVVVFAANATSSSFPSITYGTGSDGTAGSCSTSSETCFTGPTAAAFDCSGGVWIGVSGTVNNASIAGPGILYFPSGSKTATALYLPNITSDFSPTIFDIAFNSDCSMIAIAGSYRVYLGNLAFPISPLISQVPTISGTNSYGQAGQGQTIPNASPTTNSLYLVQSVAFDYNNKYRLAIADVYHDRVVYVTYGTNSSSSGFPIVIPSTSPSTTISSSPISQTANASTISSPSASFTSAMNASASFSPAASLTSAANSTAASFSASASFALSNSAFLPSFSTSSTSTSTATATATATATSTATFTSTFTSTATATATFTSTFTSTATATATATATFTGTPSESMAPTYTPEAPSNSPYSAGVKLQSWVQLISY